MEQFIDYLEMMAKEIWVWSEEATRVKAIKTKADLEAHRLAVACYMCNKRFDNSNKIEKNYDHDHITGVYRGAACDWCNRKMYLSRRSLPLYFHNYRGYDNHHIVHAFRERKGWLIEPIAQNPEKFMAMSAKFPIGETENGNDIYINFCFRDSFQVLSEGLATLVENVGETALIQTLKMEQIYNVSKEVILAKGVFPYSFFNSFDKMKFGKLPEIEDFYDALTQCNIEPATYVRAQKAWGEFKCVNMGDYMLRYLEMDVRQLCDVFERFRDIAKKEDGLDGGHFLTIS